MRIGRGDGSAWLENETVNKTFAQLFNVDGKLNRVE